MTGSYPMSVDSKARITLPIGFRKELDSKALKLVPYHGCVYGFTPKGFDDWMYGLFNSAGHEFNQRSSRDELFQRVLNSSATDVEIDSAGRIALGKLDVAKPGRREQLGLTGEVMVVGNGSHFEVWSSDAWARILEDFETRFDELAYDD